MKKQNTITLTTAGTAQKVERSKFELPKGKKMQALRLKMTVPIANSTGGSVTLSATQKKALLALFITTLSAGKGGHRKPFNAISLKVMRLISRFALGFEMEGWSNSATGLGRSLPNSSTTSVVFWADIPTGALHMMRGRQLFKGVGRSMANSLELELKYTSATIDTGLVITGNVTAELVPLTRSCKGDHADVMAEYYEASEKDKVFTSEDGLPLLVIERSAVHASSALTSFSLHIDGEPIHEDVSAAEALVDYEAALSSGELTSEASITDEATVLYAVKPGETWDTLPTGKVRFEQKTKDLGTAEMGVYYVPIIAEDKGKADIAAAAAFRSKPVRAVSLVTVEGHEVPHRMRPFLPYVLFDRDDVEFEQFPGYVAQPGSDVVAASIPPTVLHNARQVVSFCRETGESKREARVYEDISGAHPYVIQSGRGFSGAGSRGYNDVRELILKG